MGKSRGRKHIIVPDTQVKPGVPINHLTAIGNYIADQRPDVIVHLGDHWDMPSLSLYDKRGSAAFEGRRYAKDVAAGNEAMHRLVAPYRRLRSYKPRQVFLLGNHEERINRAINLDPILEGTIGIGDLALGGWEVHPFLEIVEIDGILMSHFFVNPQSLMKSALAGTIDNRLNKLKRSFTMGHQQVRLWGTQFTGDGKEIMGLVCGACYQHDEDYLGPQGNKHYWRGIVVKHEVRDGVYDPMFVSLKYLLEKWL